ncbi:MAG: asparagine synthase-related protein, partial [Cytophagales bacterium]
FAFFDLKNQKAFLVRDFFGTKPLYYIQENNRFVFSSELTFLTSCFRDNSLEKSAVVSCLQQLWTEAPITLFKEIKKLCINQTLVVDLATGLVEEKKTSQFKKDEIDFPKKRREKYWIDKLEHLILENLKWQSKANTEVGYLLSGGLDSSLLLAMATTHGLANKKTKAFSLLAEQGKNYDGFENDWTYASSLAKKLGVEIEGVMPEEYSEKNLKKWVKLMDEPILTPAIVGLDALCSRANEQGFRVLISGLGADELFGGYGRHQLLLKSKQVPKIPMTFLSLLRPFLKINNRRFDKIAQILSSSRSLRIAKSFHWLSDETMSSLLQHQIPEPSIEMELNWSNLLNYELRTYLAEHNLLYADRIGMKNHIEIRVPYLTQEIYEIGHLSTEFLLKNHLPSKYLLKKVAEKYLPKSIIHRKKTGFGGSLKQFFLNHENSFWMEYFEQDFLDKQGIFNAQKLRQILDEQVKGKKDNSYPLLAFIALQLWMKEHVGQGS